MKGDGLHPARLFETKDSSREWRVCASSEMECPLRAGGSLQTKPVPRGCVYLLVSRHLRSIAELGVPHSTKARACGRWWAEIQITEHFTCGHRGTGKMDESIVHVSWVWCSSQELAQWPGSHPVSCPATPSTRKMNKVFVKRHQQGTPCTWGWLNFFHAFQWRTLFLAGPFFVTRGYNTLWKRKHFLPACLKTSLCFFLTTSCEQNTV